MPFKFILPLLGLSLMISCQPDVQNKPSTPLPADRFEAATYENSRYIADKAYQVFLPASYAREPNRHYPVLYMMDLQNLFLDSLAYGGTAWNVHSVIDSLVNAGAMEEVIVVGIAHAGEDRFSEYMPQAPVDTFSQAQMKAVNSMISKPVYSDDFLKFLVNELKPKIDSTYRSLVEAKYTFVVGSSMGGLISMYALCEYPEVFGGALCLSTHWSVGMGNSTPEPAKRVIRYFAENVPAEKKWYFDHGTEGLDQYYAPWQAQVDSIMEAKGYSKGKNWISKKFAGHDHNEKYWHARLHIPLTFAFGTVE